MLLQGKRRAAASIQKMFARAASCKMAHEATCVSSRSEQSDLMYNGGRVVPGYKAIHPRVLGSRKLPFKDRSPPLSQWLNVGWKNPHEERKSYSEEVNSYDFPFQVIGHIE